MLAFLDLPLCSILFYLFGPCTRSPKNIYSKFAQNLANVSGCLFRLIQWDTFHYTDLLYPPEKQFTYPPSQYPPKVTLVISASL